MKAYICASILLCFFIQFYSASAIKIDGLDDKVDANVTLESSCGGNCPSGGCPSCLCGTSPNDVSISSWCSQYGSWSQGCCQCIASHESGGNANAENYNSNGSYDIGLWQINDMNWPDCSSGEAPCNPSTNLNCAIMIWQWGGHTWKYWSTCSVCGCCNSP